ncbi:MAG: histidinol dehydrogenase [Saccharofermentanales bacterium]
MGEYLLRTGEFDGMPSVRDDNKGLMKTMGIRIVKSNGRDLGEITASLGLRAKMDRADVIGVVSGILEDVRLNGDEALCRYTARFDKAVIAPENLRVTEAEIDAAMAAADPALIAILQKAYANIMEFHLAQKSEDVRLDRGKGSYVGLISRPLDTAGIYVPGGTAPLPSSVLMNIVPAKAAGVRRIVMCTPPRPDGSVDAAILAAARIAGADEVYRAGGAQAIAAMAYGTASVPSVDKICGPGNIYVNTAKRLVYGKVDIDMFAGPSEILILADRAADPAFLAADLLSQAEHDVLASAILITDSEEIAAATAMQIDARAQRMPRLAILNQSLADYCAIIIVPDLAYGIEFANELAPEHLELCVADPDSYLPAIRNAGAVFVGNYSPEALGDYFAGPNHVLPTSGTARFFSPLNTGDFIKMISVIRYTEDSLRSCYRDIAGFARAEMLECHAQSALVRFGDDVLGTGQQAKE